MMSSPAQDRPRYIDLHAAGELARRVERLEAVYEACTLCPHECGVNRRRGEQGRCRSGAAAVVASANVHTGEEPPISGTRGSGTIFLSGCTGSCIFCQNYPISQLHTGKQVADEQLAEMMLALQKRGVHNINFVTPTHFVPSIVSALRHAVPLGLEIPMVYNTSGFESAGTLGLLDGIIDIYLPDAKYDNDETAHELSGFSVYVENNRRALYEMYRQVGKLRTRNGVAVSGLIVRHLVLPGHMSGTEQVMRHLAEAISPDVHVSLMNQYFPAHKALKHPVIARRITREEYEKAEMIFFESGLHNGWIQEYNVV